MLRLWDLIATKHRNARAFAAIVQSVTEQVGEPLMDDLPERRGFVGVVMLPDSTTLEILLPKPPPKVGEKIPLRFERYESGDRNHAFDARAWRLYGSPP